MSLIEVDEKEKFQLILGINFNFYNLSQSIFDLLDNYHYLF